MIQRPLAAACLAATLCGCASPRLPRIDLSGMTLPDFEIFRYGVADPGVKTTPYVLTQGEIAAIKEQFSEAFTDGRTLEFGPFSARRSRKGDLVVCGLVNVRRPAGTYTGMKLFEGVARPAAGPGEQLTFTPRRIAGPDARPIDIYSFCRDAGML